MTVKTGGRRRLALRLKAPGPTARKGRGEAMWPDVAGPEWQWHLLATIGLLTAVFAAIWLADSAAAKAASHEEPESPDLLLLLWHRYEVGDLTRREFEREQTAALARRTPAPETRWTWTAMDPTAHAALNGSARSSKQRAAAGAGPVEG